MLSFLLGLLWLSAVQQPCPPTPSATASIEGVVVRLGTNEPISGVDVELIRVEGAQCSPLAAGSAETYSRMLSQGGNGSRDVPAALSREAFYVKTNDSGQFAFRNLKEGRYRLVAERGGGAYAPAAYGQRDPRGDGLAFPLADGQALKNYDIPMAATGAISGRVFDSDGEPISHALVLALEPQYKHGRRVLNIAQAVETDERGEFRLFWLTPGRYYVAARLVDTRRRTQALWIVPPGRTGINERGGAPVITRQILPSGEVLESTYGLVYYGGTLNPDEARPLDLLPGATFPGADVPIADGRIRSWHIRGRLVGAAGEAVANRQIRAVPVRPAPDNVILTTTTGADGTFDFSGAVPGRYAVFSPSGGSGNLSMSSTGEIVTGVPYGSRSMPYLEIDVGNADVNDMILAQRANSPATATNRVTIDGRPPGVDEIPNFRVDLIRDPDTLGLPISTSAPPARGAAAAASPGLFRLVDAGLGLFRMAVSGLPPNGYVKSIRMGATDILANGLRVGTQPLDPIEVTLGLDAGVLTGVAINDRRDAMSNVVVAAVPDLPEFRGRLDLYRSATTDANGRFQLSVPPGDYRLFAWEYAPRDAWTNADFMKTFEQFGRAIRVAAASRQDTQLNVIAVQR